jgi:NAD(P)-dependent dehydrogenase (short-subunit alcohol dehydrogenase family)
LCGEGWRKQRRCASRKISAQAHRVGPQRLAQCDSTRSYSESLDHELRTRGIRVSVIEPAYTKTQFDANFLEPDSKLDEYREVRAVLGKTLKEEMAAADGAGRRGRCGLESADRGSPEGAIHSRWAREPPAMASQIRAKQRAGRRNSKGPTPRHADSVAASHAGLGKVVERQHQ